MRLYYTINRYDKDGLISSTGKTDAKSFVKAFIYYLASSMAGSGYLTERTSGTPGDMGANGGTGTRVFYSPQGSNEDYVGIVVGSGTNVVQSSDYKLQTIITNGSSAGNLLFGPHDTDESVTLAIPNAGFSMGRIFKNVSGGDVTINEIGLYEKSMYRMQG